MDPRNTFPARATAALCTLAALVAAAPGPAAAHPGHGTAAHAMGAWDGLVHLLTQPDHLALLALAVGAGAWAGRRALQARRRQAARRDR